MDSREKKTLSEADIKAKFITPAILGSGWDEMTQVRREVTLTPGPVVVRGNLSSRNKKKKKFADYVLQKEKGVPVAVIEAKDNNHTISEGLQQALGYADLLDVPCAFSSNGDGFASHDKTVPDGQDIETEFGMDDFPGPDELWRRYKAFRGISDALESLVTEPYFDDGSKKEPRYYQAEAINRVIEKVAQGEKRLLLVMATGTGKTYTTFQIIYRLWKAKRVKRVLFLVDRNILADQTLVNDFKPFGSVMTKIRNRKIDPSYEVYLGLYQALTGPYEEDKIFKSVGKDFFLDPARLQKLRLLCGNPLEQHSSRLILGVLRNELAHHGQLKDSLFELVDALFGGEEGVEMLGDALPAAIELGVVGSDGERVQQGGHQGLMGVKAGVGLLFQLVAQRHQFVDSGNNANLFSKWRNRN